MKKSSLIYISKLLVEGRVDDLKAKYVDNLDLSPIKRLKDKDFNVLVKGDPSGNQKYLEWMIKVIIRGYAVGIGTHYIVGLVKVFHEKQKRLPKKDLYQYGGYHELEKAFKELQPSKSEMRKIQKEGSHKLYEDEKYLIVAPTSKEGSCYYGQGTKWCTSSKRQNQFEEYTEQGTLIYIIDKKGESNKEGGIEDDYEFDLSKVALRIPFHLYEPNMKHLNDSDIEIYDAGDIEVNSLGEDENVLWSDLVFTSEDIKLKMQDAMVKYFKGDWNERGDLLDDDWHVDGGLDGDEEDEDDFFNESIHKKILMESDGFDWVEEHQFTQEEIMRHIKGNNITEWTFGEHWDGHLTLNGTSIETLGNLKSVGGNLYLGGTLIKDLGNLQSVGGSLTLNETSIETLGNLKSVGGNLYLGETLIETLGNLKSVGGNLYLYGSSIKNLGNLKSVGGDLYLYGSSIKNLGNLKSVGGDLDLDETSISKKYSENEIRQMVQVNGDVYL